MPISRTVLPTDSCLISVDGNNPNDFLELQYFPVEGFEYDRTASIEQRQVAGRNLQTLHNTGGSKSLSIRLAFTPEREDRLDMRRKIRWLESLTYNDGFKTPAPIVIVKLGDIIQEGRWVVSSVKPSQSIFSRIKDGNLDSNATPSSGLVTNLAYVDIVFMRWAEYNVTRADILEGTTQQDLNQIGSSSYKPKEPTEIDLGYNRYYPESPTPIPQEPNFYNPEEPLPLTPDVTAKKEWQRKQRRERFVTARQEIINVGIQLFKATSTLLRN